VVKGEFKELKLSDFKGEQANKNNKLPDGFAMLNKFSAVLNSCVE